MVCTCVLLLFLATVFAGCTQPAQPPQVLTTEPTTATPTPLPTTEAYQASVEKTDDTHIVVTYLGGPDMEKIRAVQATVTNSRGVGNTKHLGDSLGTTSVSPGSKLTFEGVFAGSTQVSVIAFYGDGSQRTLFETTV